MARQTVTVYFDENALQVLVTRGGKASKWARVPLEPDMVRGAMILNEVEVASRLKDIFKTQKISSRKVVVGLSGLHSLTRPTVFPAMSKARLTEAIVSEAKKVLPVPLEQLYVSWRSTPARGQKVDVFIVAVPRNIVDAAVSTLSRAGLKPRLLDIKPLALARLVKGPAIIVDVQPTELDVLVISKGIPQPIRTVTLGEGPLAEKFKTISDDVFRTVDFYNSNNPQEHLDPTAPLYVGGELAAEPGLAQELSKTIGHPLLFLSSPITWRRLPDAGPYLVNVGLALKEAGKLPGAACANLNALPEAYREKPPSMVRAAAVPLVAGAVALVIPMVIVLQSTSAGIESTRGQLAMVNRLLNQRQIEEQQLKKDIAALEKKAQKVEQTYAGLVNVIKSLKGASNRLNSDIEAMREALSGDITLSGISYSQDTITVKGRVSSRPDVLYYARKLDSTAHFSEVVIADMSSVVDKDTGPAIEFTFILREK